MPRVQKQYYDIDAMVHTIQGGVQMSSENDLSQSVCFNHLEYTVASIS
jgi:hypothetical protein